MEKVIRDGKVAVLYSEGFGAGWSTWNEGMNELVFHPKIVNMVLVKNIPTPKGEVNEEWYSIGELLSFLPPIIPQGSGYYINITHDSVSWVIDYQQHGDMQYKYIVSDMELIDAIFDMLIKIKEEGVI